jgi:putative FmdB family regulatory protein
MPLYDYKCTQCGKVIEVRHGFNESHADPCPACGGALQRVFSAAPIVFKGSGYYITDSRKPSAPESTGAASEASKPASSSDSTPAKASEPAA